MPAQFRLLSRAVQVTPYSPVVLVESPPVVLVESPPVVLLTSPPVVVAMSEPGVSQGVVMIRSKRMGQVRILYMVTTQVPTPLE